MPHKFLIMAIAIALAAGVLMLALWLDPPKAATTRVPIKLEPKPTTGPGFDPDRLPTGDIMPTTGEYRVDRFDRHGRLIQIFGKKYTPLPAHEYEIEHPRARIHLSESRIFQIEADEGNIIAPDNQPRAGHLQNNVRLTFFQSRDGRPIRLADDSPDIVMIAYFDEARFDLELGLIMSDSAVFVTGPNMEFNGHGLRLTYNARLKRVDRIEIKAGKDLRFRSASPSRTALKPRASTLADAPVITDGDDVTIHFANDAVPAPDDHDDPPTSTEEDLFYRATFFNNVRIVSDNATFTGDELQVVFDSVGKKSPSPDEQPQLDTAASKPRTSPSADSSTTAPAAEPLPFRRSMMTHSDNDAVITWSGPLLIVPEQTVPHELFDFGGLFVQMIGSPVRVHTANNETATASLVTYLTEPRITRLIGSQREQISLQSPAMGVITGPELTINEQTGLGEVIGAGKLITGGENLGTGEQAGPHDDLTVTWTDRLTMAFRTKPDANSGSSQIGAIEKATFLGTVAVDHARFNLQSRRLELLTDPADAQQQIRHVQAYEQVTLAIKSQESAGTMTIRSDELRMDTQRGSDGTLEPTQMLASGNVVAEQSEQMLRSQQLLVELARDTQAGSDTAGFAVRSMTATDDVQVDMSEQKARLVAQRLVSQPQNDHIEIFGSAEAPARLVREDSALTGRHIVIRQQMQTMHVLGPGSIVMDNQGIALADVSANKLIDLAPQRNLASHDADEKPLSVTVTWNDRMDYDDASGIAEFFGEVVTDARRGNDTSKLTSGQLTLIMTGETSAGAAARNAGTSRQIQRVTAMINAVLLTENFADAPDKSLQRRLRITGNHLLFDNMPEQLQVIGPGTMLIEDQRPQREPTPQANTVKSNELVQFSGRGATVFRWRGKLTLDAHVNDMTIEEAVQMLHRPFGDQQPMQLDTMRLVADFESTGGLGAWTAKQNAPQPRLLAVNASGSVRVITEDRTINTDYLTYNGAEQTVLLRAEKGNMSEVIDRRDNKPQRAESLRWYLDRNRIEVVNPGPIRLRSQ